ncbi:GNAT family N-acetyltransferase [Hydrogenophaga intermedia]|jgi:N-acetylglutamate synthase|uniref:GNAT family N-acetyltransferase n=1 Tax=Hydrogenophaga intermedia TaxID=65786 RepID=UPI002042D905|nr:GNAT family N-acetyltransferase [Hydrogenophaga intermedia]MCM3564254.1 GNAT family N-acetyltransferase [Hydrogenophaga intermedia]
MRGAADVDSLERATVQAVAPEQLDDTVPGWLLPMDPGTVGRAQCAVPLSHAEPDVGLIDTIVQRYRERGFAPAWRLPDVPSFATFHTALGQRGFTRRQPTLTQATSVADLLERLPARPGPDAVLEDRPDAAWLAMFLGEGLDPVDGASRSRALARAVGTRYASLRENGVTLACGAASFGHGWLGVHGMRTAAAQRRRGLAGAVMRAMATEARQRGVERVFLQVDASNAPALSLYQRLGFETAWGYAYWRY